MTKASGKERGSACPLCRGRASLAAKWKGDYSIHGCSSCGLLFADPIPTDEELHEFYQGFLYRKPNIEEIEQQILAKQAELAMRFGWNGNAPQGTTLLDHGGGTGVAYAASKRLGCETYYYEVDEQAIDFVKQHFGLTEERCFRTEQELADSGQVYDCIFSDNVIEHVQEPAEYLENIYSLLSAGGQLVVKTPHARNAQTWFYPRIALLSYAKIAMKQGGLPAAFRVLTGRIWHCDPPRHIYSFTAKSILQAAKNGNIPSHEASIDWYRVPLWEYSLTSQYFRKPGTPKGWLLRILTLPLLLLEWLLKTVQVIGSALGLVSASGLILAVKKGS